ncbi:CDC27 family protein [Sulfurovum mangrovi]|uniref:CDC27 family protein n=1 Tax=Sulfurovum mangrovi TaxID=2893889 RepID=UPI001E39B84A|nr:CDC27 family protein [Sulfurovum mangrovi]UFH58604.1 CDC27 family protein [Sulfurovum mangrovi]
MYDIEKLEKEWVAYNKKKKRPFYIFSVFIILCVASVLTLYFNDFLNGKVKDIFNSVTKEKMTHAPTEHVASIESNQSVTEEKSQTATPERVKQTLKVSKAPQIIIEEKPKPYDSAMKEPVLEEVESLDNVKKADLSSPQDESSSKKMHLDILETSSVTAYKDVERRFYQTHDADDSLFLAKSYFNRGEYKKAEYWALQTNKVDSSIEESWLLFAHAKAKLGQKNDAIKVLNSYIGKSNSLEARRLLEKIK